MNTRDRHLDRAAALEAERRLAVQQRDKAHDGEFIYAVRSTGVYCRPSCASRPARPENIAFFDTTHLAAAAGYRPCKRCRPDEMPQEARRQELVLRACAALQASASGIRLDTLAADAKLAPHHFHRIFKSVTGVTPKAYFQALRAQRMQASLPGARSVTEAIHGAGFNGANRFYEDKAAALGMQPRHYRDGGAGQRIRHAAAPCALGVILVAATDKGVCAIEFGDSAHALAERLQQRFPKATFETGDADFHGLLARVLRFVEQPHGVLDLPLDVQGTVFQRQVWDALRAIPGGQTRSYAQVAQAVGRPQAVRAVATACASNTLAMAIPCHRALRGNGQLAGYRWGVERKAELLRREQLAYVGAA